MDRDELPDPRDGLELLWEPSCLPDEILVTSRFTVAGPPGSFLTHAERKAICDRLSARSRAWQKLGRFFMAGTGPAATDFPWDPTDMSGEFWYRDPFSIPVRRSAVPGAVLNGYVVLQRTSHGGFAIVYCGYDPWTGAPVALKIPKSRQALSVPAVRAEFENEVNLLSLCRHPNIVRLARFGCDFPRDVPVIAMEFVVGRSLARIIDLCVGDGAGNLPEAQVLAIAVQLARAVEYLHAHGISHGDIKPGNARLERYSLRVVLLDFATSRLRRASDAAGESTAPSLTPDYSSVERLEDPASGPTRKDDCFALAATIADLYCGQPTSDVLQRVLAGERRGFERVPERRVEHLTRAANPGAGPLVDVLVEGLRGRTTAADMRVAFEDLHRRGFGA